MSESKHTPGPWVKLLNVDTESDAFWEIKAQPHPAMRGFTKLVAYVERESDAELIASAPSLLSDLEQLREENEALRQQVSFSEEIKKQMQIRISDEMVRTFNRDQNITQLENLCCAKDMQIVKLKEEGKQSLLLYNSMTKNIEQLQEYIGHQEGHVNAIKEDRDNFTISFAVWAMHNTQAQAYQAAGITAYDLLEKYKSRPFVDTDNTGNQ